MAGRTDQRGSATVELALALPIVFLLSMGCMTIVQALYDSHRLAAAVEDGTRYATRADYEPDGTAQCANVRRRTISEVETFTAAAAGGGQNVVVTVTGDPCTAQAGDEVTVTVRDKVSNPLYMATAAMTNAFASLFGRTPFNPSGLPIKAEAQTYVE
jgi:Flp pilus assembly protein TadG